MKTSSRSCAPIGRLVARTLTAMGAALEPGMTTRELDDLGRALLEKEGARSAPELTYDFPGATCISVGPDCAHGIPDDTAIKAGDLINIDVSAELDGVLRRHRRELRRAANQPQDRTPLRGWPPGAVGRHPRREAAAPV